MEREQRRLLIGCVADDFTGASDAASFLANNGAQCLLFSGVPNRDYALPGGYDAVVVALKTRSVKPALAVTETGAAFRWLSNEGAEKLYFKYCSTFDSTKEGNIGPVLDSLLETYDLCYTTLCPALPVNNRTVRDGHLYVNGIPLDQSHMKHHPLNPMWDSFIPNLMQPQSKYPSHVLDHKTLTLGDEAVRRHIEDLLAKGEKFHLILDCLERDHGVKLAGLFADLPLNSGGSSFVGEIFRTLKPCAKSRVRSTAYQGRGLILSGSCSEATLGQVRYFLKHGGASFMIDPVKLAEGSLTLDEIWSFIETRSGDVLVYSSQDHSDVKRNLELSGAAVSELLEQTMANLGSRAASYGIKNIVVAGGETSGAVTRALNYSAYEIGASVDPGVPILYPLYFSEMQIVLKSGNFGGEDFFVKALAMMRKES